MQSFGSQNIVKNRQHPSQKVVIELTFTWHSINANFLMAEDSYFLVKITSKTRH